MSSVLYSCLLQLPPWLQHGAGVIFGPRKKGTCTHNAGFSTFQANRNFPDFSKGKQNGKSD